MIHWKELLTIIGLNTLVFFTLLFLTRIVGKKQLSHMTFFNYITGITLGSIAANTVNINKASIYDDYIALFCWSILVILIGIITLKIPSIRGVIDGQPTIVIKKGKLQRKALKALEMNIEDLLMILRTKDIFRIKDVDYAIIEANGEISVLKDASLMGINKKDMNIKVSNNNFITSRIIVDGVLIEKNLKELNIDKKWIETELNKQGIHTIKDVFFAEIQDDGTLYIDQ